MLNDEQQLKIILDETKSLIDLAEADDWEAVIKLEKSRDAKIAALFSHKPKITPTVLAAGIESILKDNRRLALYSSNQRDSLRLEMSKAGHAHKAINSYLTAAN